MSLVEAQQRYYTEVLDMSASPLATTPRLSSMSSATSVATGTVFIVDDDVSVRESLQGLIADAGWRPEAFASAEEFLAHPRQPVPSALVLDVGLHDVTGWEPQSR